ncbi:hypothetical protein N9395_09935, partial [Pseudomonadales bacterium]|nr:hypothetical protein [Pseudomonadales bacterium]
ISIKQLLLSMFDQRGFWEYWEVIPISPLNFGFSNDGSYDSPRQIRSRKREFYVQTAWNKTIWSS